MAIEVNDNIILNPAFISSKQLADITYIKGAFKTYISASDMQNAPIVSIDDKQIVWVEDSGSLYQATKTLANPPFTFSDTVVWNAFSFGGESVSTGSLLTTASVAGNTMTFTKGNNNTFDVTLPGGSTPGGLDTQVQFNSGGSALGGSPRFTFDNTGLVKLSGSFQITSSTSNDIFLIKSGSIEVAKVNNDGVFVLGEMETTPPAVEGGIYYSSSAFYVGIE